MEPHNDASRRDFLKKASLGTVGLAMGMNASSYARIIGANDRVRVGIAGFSDRFKASLLPSFMEHAKGMNFEFVGVSDIWNRRRDECEAHLKEKGWLPKKFVKARNHTMILGLIAGKKQTAQGSGQQGDTCLVHILDRLKDNLV